MLAVAPTAIQVTAAHAAGTGTTDGQTVKGNCVAPMETIEQMKAGSDAKLTCFDTYAEVLAYLGVKNPDPQATPLTTSAKIFDHVQARSGSRTFTTRALATHFSDATPGGDTLTVTGTACDGGGISLSGSSAYMNNRVRATRHWACGTVKHYTSADGSGDPCVTQGTRGTDRTVCYDYRNDVSSIAYAGTEQP